MNHSRGRDPVIEAYKKDIDRTLIRKNLKLSHEERLQNAMELQRFAQELRKAGRRVKRSAGRPKDIEAISELEAIREEQQNEECFSACFTHLSQKGLPIVQKNALA